VPPKVLLALPHLRRVELQAWTYVFKGGRSQRATNDRTAAALVAAGFSRMSPPGDSVVVLERA
jgi:hypothetical protein